MPASYKYNYMNWTICEMNHRIWLLFYWQLLRQVAFLAATIKYVTAEVFTALADIKPLVRTHGSVIESLEEYLEAEKRRLTSLKKHLNDYKNEHKRMDESTGFFGNPINSFVVIKRLTTDLDYIENLIKTGTIFNRKSDMIFPTKEDLEGAATALTRLQTTYNLNITHLAEGILHGTFSHGNKPYTEQIAPTSASDCLVMGSIMYSTAQYKESIEWLMQALQKYLASSEDYPFDEAVIVDYIRSAYHGMNDTENALEWTNRLLKLKPEMKDDTISALLVDYEKRLQKIPTFLTSRDYFQQYAALCRGDVPLAEVIRKNLKCYYMTGPEPFLFLAPIKTEQLYIEPEVLMFYDVISDSEIREIQRLAQPNLRRATVSDNKTGKAISAEYRISKSAWLDDSTEVVARVSRRVSHFTTLDMETAELLQVGNYGIGGHYEPHYDFIKATRTPDRIGNRVATVLFYMSNVEQGGATVFLDLGVTVFPVKNSAIFWMNLHPSGEPDQRTRHAACPVLRGSKWVSNKWIHLTGQEFLRPCTLEHQQ